jgi:geranylgeranyl pyrophosphate synthase
MKEHSKSSIESAKKIFEERGKKGYESAKKAILEEKLEYKPLREALEYFMKKVWRNFEHPALLSLACESVGGNPKSSTLFGACLVLFTGAADIHDDIIDQSRTKGSKLTVFGKFGRDIALLVGDALLVKGYTLLNKACEKLPKKEANTITNLVKEAFFEIGNAEAEETNLKGDWNADPEVCFNIMKRKSAIAAMTAKIGAIVGGGSSKEVIVLGEYGRILAMLSNLRNEFVDTYEPDELVNRMRNECLPIPILYAFRNQEIKSKIASLLVKGKLRNEEAAEIAHVIMSTREVLKLKRRMKNLAKKGINLLTSIEDQKVKELLNLLLTASIESL